MDLSFNPNAQGVFLLGQIVLDYNQNQTDASSRDNISDGVGDKSPSGDGPLRSRAYNPEAAEFYPIRDLGPPKVYIHGPTHYEITAGNPPIATHLPFSNQQNYCQQQQYHHVHVPGNGYSQRQPLENTLPCFQQKNYQSPPLPSSTNGTFLDNRNMRPPLDTPTSGPALFPQAQFQVHQSHYPNQNPSWMSAPGGGQGQFTIEDGGDNLSLLNGCRSCSFCPSGDNFATGFNTLDDYMAEPTPLFDQNLQHERQHQPDNFDECESPNISSESFKSNLNSYGECVYNEKFVENPSRTCTSTRANSSLSITSSLQVDNVVDGHDGEIGANPECQKIKNDRSLSSFSVPESQFDISGHCLLDPDSLDSIPGNGNANFNPFAREFYPVSSGKLSSAETDDETSSIKKGEGGDCDYDCDNSSGQGDTIKQDQVADEMSDTCI